MFTLAAARPFLDRREKIKRRTVKQRRSHYHNMSAEEWKMLTTKRTC